ncbi:hypothetical protein [Aliarcobacter skirrowii]|mgnify:CR=1 FL=1|jgi:hypothetical protein|uniref:hypothetical protein n=1 Tax=Aliarcobacter skirrowii TaxID=28200 RepID=UPI00082D3DB3|nr:hypothetical protein [Aliarcobacter skirrowii]
MQNICLKNLKENIVLFQSELLVYDAIYERIQGARKFYPNFENWYYSKVIPDIITNKREIILEQRNDKVVGLSIIKFDEKKLCTLKIFDEYINKGYGLKLFNKSFEKLETDKPFLTVSEEKYNEFKKIFNYYNFELTSIKENLYIDGKKEYFYNEF